MVFVVIEPENLPHNHATKKSKKTISKKKRRTRTRRKGKQQYGGFLNHYDFAYAGRDTVNQAAKVAPSIIKAATNDVNKIAEQRINQVISQGGKELECVLPKNLTWSYRGRLSNAI